jgi:hypothetical protein
VYHRAYPRGSSVNDHIPGEWAALEYATVDQSIALIAAQGPGAMLITGDLQDAFRHIPSMVQGFQTNYLNDRTCLNRQTNGQTNSQTSHQTSRQTSRLTRRQTNVKPVVKRAVKPAVKPVI